MLGALRLNSVPPIKETHPIMLEAYFVAVIGSTLHLEYNPERSCYGLNCIRRWRNREIEIWKFQISLTLANTVQDTFGSVPGSLLHQVGQGYTDLLSALLVQGQRYIQDQSQKSGNCTPHFYHLARGGCRVDVLSYYYGRKLAHLFTSHQD